MAPKTREGEDVAYTNQVIDLKKASERFLEEIRNDPVKLKKWLRELSGPETRTLTGQEREHMITVFNLIEPVGSSNNQHTLTDVYEHAGKTYHVHYFEKDTVIEEVLPDDFQ
jgi:hypothetical protein